MINHLKRDFLKYVSLNILGMIGLSCYIFADTYFIAEALGTNGLAALNFSISIFCIVSGTGMMIGMGAATDFAIESQKGKCASNSFTHALTLVGFFSAIFVILGWCFAKPVAMMLGADQDTLPLTVIYLKTILSFAPCFILNSTIHAFVRNDGNPRLSMMAMLTSSMSNIVLDYIFIFPLGMGIFGAAFATGLAPVISLSMLALHFLQKKNTFHFAKCKIKLRHVFKILSLGVTAFIGELASSMSLIVFNLLILNIAGNTGVAAYGVVANIALIATAIYAGVSQGMQPLASTYYGKGDRASVKQIFHYAVMTSLGIAIIIYIIIYVWANPLAQLFNGEQNDQLGLLAVQGLKIYFLGYFFAGMNMIIAAFLSAIDRANMGIIIALLRSCILLVPVACILSLFCGMTGVWSTFVVTECMVLIVIVIKRKRLFYT